jgi:hypothetical protein
MDGFPREFDPGAHEQGALAYIHGLGREAWPFVLLLLFVALAVAYWYDRRRRRREAIADRRLGRIREACHAEGLTEAEERALLRALRRADPATPDAAVASREYFEEFLAPTLARGTDDATYRSIRRKLFPEGTGAPGRASPPSR